MPVSKQSEQMIAMKRASKAVFMQEQWFSCTVAGRVMDSSSSKRDQCTAPWKVVTRKHDSHSYRSQFNILWRGERSHLCFMSVDSRTLSCTDYFARENYRLHFNACVAVKSRKVTILFHEYTRRYDVMWLDWIDERFSSSSSSSSIHVHWSNEKETCGWEMEEKGLICNE